MAKLHILVGSVFIVGIIILALAARLRSELAASNCAKSARLDNAVTGLLVTGVILSIASATLGGLMAKGVLRTYEIEFRLLHITIGLVALGIVMIALGAVVASEGKSIQCDAISSTSVGVYVSGILLVVAGFVAFFTNKDAMIFAKERVAMKKLFDAFKERQQKSEASNEPVESS